MAACRRCGDSTPADANFCPACGAEVRSDVVDLDVFAQDVPAGDGHVEASDPGSSRWIIVGAIVLFAGLVGFFALLADSDAVPSEEPDEDAVPVDEPDPPAADPSTDTTEPPPTIDAEIQDPLDWSVAFADATGFPIRTIELAGSTFVYAIEGVAPWAGGGSIRTYQRDRNGVWSEAVVSIDPAATITGVWPTTGGAIATGLDPDEQPSIWRTSDGVSWTDEVLPWLDDTDLDEVVPRVATADEDMTVVVGSEPDPWAQVYEILEDRWPGLGATLNADWDPDRPDTMLVRGPFGIVLDEIDLADHDIDIEAIGRVPVDDPIAVQWQHIDGEWATSITTGRLHDVAIRDDGIAVLSSSDIQTGVRMLRPDGLSESVEFGDDVWPVQPWRDRYVGPHANDGITVFGRNGERLETIAVPRGADSAHIVGLATSEAGIALVESRWVPNTGPAEPDRIVVLRDGFTLETNDGELRVLQGDEVLLRSSLFWQGSADRYLVDPAQTDPEVSFLDENGQPLVAFTLSELIELESATFPDDDSERLRVLLTTDGATWHGGDIDPLDGGLGFAQPYLSDAHIITYQLQAGRLPWLPAGSFRFTIAEAPLPQ